MIGQRNSLLQKIQSTQGDQKIFYVPCPWHLVHLCAGKGSQKLSAKAEDLVIDIYHLFPRSAKRKNS